MPADRAKMALTSLDSAVKAVVTDPLLHARGLGLISALTLSSPGRFGNKPVCRFV
jgi:hypothetical protein